MRIHLARRVTGHFLAIFAWTSLVQAAPSEKSPCDEFAKIQSAFTRSWDDPDVWLPGKCHENVAQLARQLQRLVPGLNMNHLSVIVIGSRNPLNPLNPSLVPTRARNACARENPLSGLVEWQYHVAIRYRDHILDLDATDQATLIPLAEYPRYFASRRTLDSYGAMAEGLVPAEELFVTTVPIQDYLRISDRDVVRASTLRPLVGEYPREPLINIGER